MRKILWMLLCVFSLEAEVEKVTIKWSPGLCHQSCANLLLERLSQIPAVESAEVHQPQGLAEIKWRPKSLFSYMLIHNALNSVGVRDSHIALKVRGTIQGRGKQFVLISDGDHSRYTLINSMPQPTGSKYVQASPMNSELPPEMRQKLIEGQMNNQMAIVEGTLFHPERGGSLQIMVEQLSFEEMKVQQ